MDRAPQRQAAVSAFETKRCASCSAPVIWTVTHNGKKMPVDAEPADNGNIRLRQEGDRMIAEYPGREHPGLFEDPDQRRYLSHFATCPQAQSWRRP